MSLAGIPSLDSLSLNTCIVHPFPLPTELIYEILEHLFPNDETAGTEFYSTFAALARTCRFLSPVATRYLRTRYISSLDNPITGFIRQVKKEPNIGEGITHIEILPYQSWPHRHVLRSRNGVKEDMRQLDLPDSLHLVEKLCANPGQVDLARLIAYTPNLQYLKAQVEDYPPALMSRVFHTIPPYFHALIKAANNLSTTPQIDDLYGRLHTIDAHLNRTFSFDIMYLFRLPSLRRLRFIFAISDRDGNELPADWPMIPESSSVETLEFENSFIPSSLVARMIFSCKALYTFGFGLWEPPVQAESSEQFHRKVLSALHFHCVSLQHLFLQPFGFWPRSAYVKSLHGIDYLYRLRKLDVPLTLLVEKSINYACLGREQQEPTHSHRPPSLKRLLPPDLEHLNLRIDQIFQPMQRFNYLFWSFLPDLDDPPGTIPNIHIVYSCWSSQVGIHFDPWDLKCAFREHGKDFTYKFYLDIVAETDGK